MNLHTINTGFFKLDGGAMFGVVPKSIWQKTNPADDKNLCTWALRCLLIEDGNRLILIDTGTGNKQDEKFFSHYHLHGPSMDESLLVKGFHRDDITDVFLTHLHFDHVGGAVARQGNVLLPAFKNAVYWSNRQHWDWAYTPNDREKASFLKENFVPLQESGHLRFIDNDDGAKFAPGIDVTFVYGHTDAQMLPLIDYKGRKVLYMADLLPSVGHLPIPYVMGYDMFPLKTMEEKKKILAEALENDYILYFEHDAVNECCTLQKTEKGIRVNEIFSLQDI
ncbi:MBL fold metallo-hydrolase [Mucilaginibacter hurinus]|uniref:MBL fold metallo-hydrolase n=1 Tax=Mucilaginibacter hurinus TaxID=2201324 RepID=A0A367GP61_9SPHI|nr:MBL fold metallo-hydrolase [Mucilaginibacter hurinus]RCH55090.1 MBL fold metallo-hydrolase [Mucilaginibacter hurinus]